MAFEKSIDWRTELRKECYWQNELSFDNLKSEKLVQNHNEWKSIYRAFRFKNVASNSIKKWLRNQKGHFRASYLSHLFICGYSRSSKVSLFGVNTVPKEIQDIILFYVNLIFIKLYTDSDALHNKYTIRTFDCNFNINNLGIILEQGEIKKDFADLRLWTRFDFLKFIYAVPKNGRDVRTYTNYQDPDEDDDQTDKKRWVQIPSDYGKTLTLKDLDTNLKYHQVLEFGVDKLRKIYFDRGLSAQKWSFKETENKTENALSHFDYICSLKVGDTVDVLVYHYYPSRWMKGFIFGRDYDTFYIFIENLSVRGRMIEIKSIGIDNLARLQRRNSRFVNDNAKLLSFNRKESNLVNCEWVTAFNCSSPFEHYPILFE